LEPLGKERKENERKIEVESLKRDTNELVGYNMLPYLFIKQVDRLVINGLYPNSLDPYLFRAGWVRVGLAGRVLIATPILNEDE